MTAFRRWLSGKLAEWSLRVHPTSGKYRRKWGSKYHIGPGGKCLNDPEWE